MAAQLDENIQYVDESSGELIVNGYIYIGTSGLDAKLNTITIYSDRELTTPISNPQRTGSDGRAVNKIWIPGKYSLKVEDSANVQKLNDLDLGESDTSIDPVGLGNVQGTNAITAEGSPTVTALVDKQTYIFIAAAGNTGAVTLKIDSTTAYPIKKNNEDFVSGEIIANQIVAVIWNDTSSIFEMINFNTTRIKTPAPELILEETGAAANNGIWGLLADSEQLKLRVGNDAEDTFVNILLVDRTANVVDLVNLLPTNLQHSGVKIPTISSTDTQTNKTFTDPSITFNGNTWPSFSVHKNGTDQTNITGKDKLTWSTEDYDNGTCFGTDAAGSNAADDRFNPGVAGKYLLTFTGAWGSLTIGDTIFIKMYKNGANYLQTQDNTDVSGRSQTITITVDFNGTTDYFEIYAANNQRDTSTILGAAPQTRFSGSRIA